MGQIVKVSKRRSFARFVLGNLHPLPPARPSPFGKENKLSRRLPLLPAALSPPHFPGSFGNKSGTRKHATTGRRRVRLSSGRFSPKRANNWQDIEFHLNGTWTILVGKIQ